jgi:hypothetical protein
MMQLGELWSQGLFRAAEAIPKPFTLSVVPAGVLLTVLRSPQIIKPMNLEPLA